MGNRKKMDHPFFIKYICMFFFTYSKIVRIYLPITIKLKDTHPHHTFLRGLKKTEPRWAVIQIVVGCFFLIGDCATQLYEDYSRPL